MLVIEEEEKFHLAGGHKACVGLVSKSARLAAEIILEPAPALTPTLTSVLLRSDSGPVALRRPHPAQIRRLHIRRRGADSEWRRRPLP